MVAMTILNTRVLKRFIRKHRDAAGPLDRWVDLASCAEWLSIVDVRKVFPFADGIVLKATDGALVATVFNIKGNQYRLVAVVDYTAATIIVREMLTHAEYSKNTWKQRL